tara:strand:- start:71 stop:952 length:882 start_codon:yes stop_codon:yes gene_type:complete
MDSKIKYNLNSSRRYGWKPNWFGADDFDENLVKKIMEFQQSLGITADGLCGPSTYRRIFTDREANIDDYEPTGEHIVYNGEFFPIEWDKVVTWDEPGGLRMNKGTYTDYSGKEPRAVTQFVNHWDVCLSSKSCASVLNKRKVSAHFCIDNDGTIYQLLDMQHKAWHAGNSIVNTKSVGVEISNAFYPKYQDWYTSRFGPRPVITDAVVHGRTLETHLGFYPVQLEAAKALWKAVSKACKVPLVAPMTSEGLDTGVNYDVYKGRFSGFFNHYNVTSNKIDCAGLDLANMLEEIK